MTVVAAAAVGATALVSFLLPKTYTAATTIVIEPKVTDVLGSANLGQQMLAQAYMATQIDIMQSQKVAERVVTNLGIPKSPAAQRQYLEETKGQGTIESYFAGQLSKRLEITPSRDSAVVTLGFSGTEPRFAADVANAYARAYIDTTLELRTSPARQYASWFDEQLKGLRADLEKAQTRLSAFQQHERDKAAAEHSGDGGGEQHARDGEAEIGEAHEHGADPSRERGPERPDREPDEHRDCDCDDGSEQRHAAPVDDAGE